MPKGRPLFFAVRFVRGFLSTTRTKHGAGTFGSPLNLPRVKARIIALYATSMLRGVAGRLWGSLKTNGNFLESKCSKIRRRVL